MMFGPSQVFIRQMVNVTIDNILYTVDNWWHVVVIAKWSDKKYTATHNIKIEIVSQKFNKLQNVNTIFQYVNIWDI